MAKQKRPKGSNESRTAGISKSVETYTINVLRRYAWARWVPRYNVLKEARQARGKYICARCNSLFGPKEVVVDHIDPVVDPEEGWKGFDSYISRLLVSEELLQVLCKFCHAEKTVEENSRRNKK